MSDFDLNKPGVLDQMREQQWHQPGHPEAAAQRLATARKLKELNDLANTEPERARQLVAELLNSDGSATVMAPAAIEYGVNTFLGRDVFLNFGVTILDSAEVHIGDRSGIAPNCQLITVGHPVDDVAMRRGGWERAQPIHIGADVWIAAGVIIFPGVTIGDRSVIGAGSLVTKDIPADCLAMGAPAKVVRQLDPPARRERDQLPEGAPVVPRPGELF
ncbi:Putative acetyltransferase [Corynebacterium occultum]|uniref:Acetyltransferase n=1 Tax=Corynebacterium occultum TaxID=2675219 RepID=A0A6B8VSX1_9CORY|nr:sugar O-acetyltransferase [Corynebacterium occultum]QGU06149.1 Putative acetyltransferase [Corynebacterium occultum]